MKDEILYNASVKYYIGQKDLPGVPDRKNNPWYRNLKEVKQNPVIKEIYNTRSVYKPKQPCYNMMDEQEQYRRIHDWKQKAIRGASYDNQYVQSVEDKRVRNFLELECEDKMTMEEK